MSTWALSNPRPVYGVSKRNSGVPGALIGPRRARDRFVTVKMFGLGGDAGTTQTARGKPLEGDKRHHDRSRTHPAAHWHLRQDQHPDHDRHHSCRRGRGALHPRRVGSRHRWPEALVLIGRTTSWNQTPPRTSAGASCIPGRHRAHAVQPGSRARRPRSYAVRPGRAPRPTRPAGVQDVRSRSRVTRTARSVLVADHAPPSRATQTSRSGSVTSRVRTGSAPTRLSWLATKPVTPPSVPDRPLPHRRIASSRCARVTARRDSPWRKRRLT